MAGAAGGGQDAKLQKLASKIESNEKLSGGHAVLVAVPAKRGGVLAAATGAVSGNVSNVVAARDRSRGGVDMASSAGKVLKMMGDGSDFVLCITDDALRIVRLIGFGILGGTPTIVPHAAITAVHTSPELKKQVNVEFTDASVLGFQIPKESHREALGDVAASTWGG